MITSQRGIALIKHYEGVRVRPYRCPAGLWTVGVGHLIGDGKQLPDSYNKTFTTAEVDALLRLDLKRFEIGVTKLLPNVKLTSGEFSCCVSFSFNHGLGLFQRSTFRQAVIRGDKEAAMESLLKYCKARVKGVLTELKGLKNRRLDEKQLFLYG
jgi:lysozyme